MGVDRTTDVFSVIRAHTRVFEGAKQTICTPHSYISSARNLNLAQAYMCCSERKTLRCL